MIGLKRFAGLLLAPMMVVAASAAPAEEVGKVGVDWLGNDIVIDAVQDPKVQGVTCHLASFSRGMIDRLQKGNWFEDPSHASRQGRSPSATSILARVENGFSPNALV